MSQHLTVVEAPAGQIDTMEANPVPGHILGPVADDWEAIDVWLRSLHLKWAAKNPDKALKTVIGKNGLPEPVISETEKTYRQHLAKLRWYCENVGRITPSRWTTQDALHFAEFLDRLPEDARCARRVIEGIEIENSYVEEGEPGWTPFRKQPSTSSQADIKRFVHAMFNAWHQTGYIRINPMALVGAGGAKQVNADRAITLDLFELVLETIAAEATETFERRQMQVRDLFIFEALRGLGLRASELVGARMTAFFQLMHPKTRVRYWIFHVEEETAKGGKARKVPVPPSVWQRFVDYRAAFGLSPAPLPGDETLLLLSPRTRDVKIGAKTIKRTPDRRFFKAWGDVGSRKGLYKIVKQRLKQAADSLRDKGEIDMAAHLEQASPHWLRHTFGKAKVQEGVNLRPVAEALGHASINTAMIYTDQAALDLIDAFESATPGCVARETAVGG